MIPNDNSSKIGMITEQGDLGLGFNPLNEEDTETLHENEKESGKYNDR